MKRILPLLSSLLFLIVFSACRENNVSPVRNIRFDPDLLNKMQVAGDACASYSYFDGSQDVNLGPVYTRRVLIAFEANVSLTEQQHVLAKYGFLESMGSPQNAASGVLQSLVLQDGLSCKQVEQALVTLAANAHITYAAPFFLDGGQLLGISNEATVAIEPDGLGKLEELAKNYKAELLPTPASYVYLIKVNKHSKGNALELTSFLQTQAGIIRATPNFILAAD